MYFEDIKEINLTSTSLLFWISFYPILLDDRSIYSFLLLNYEYYLISPTISSIFTTFSIVMYLYLCIYIYCICFEDIRKINLTSTSLLFWILFYPILLGDCSIYSFLLLNYEYYLISPTISSIFTTFSIVIVSVLKI